MIENLLCIVSIFIAAVQNQIFIIFYVFLFETNSFFINKTKFSILNLVYFPGPDQGQNFWGLRHFHERFNSLTSKKEKRKKAILYFRYVKKKLNVWYTWTIYLQRFIFIIYYGINIRFRRAFVCPRQIREKVSRLQTVCVHCVSRWSKQSSSGLVRWFGEWRY